MAEQPKEPYPEARSPAEAEAKPESGAGATDDETSGHDAADELNGNAETNADAQDAAASGDVEDEAEAKQEQLGEPARPGVGVGTQTNTRLTLALSAAVFLTTFLAWGAGKVACNHHPPYYQKIKPAPLERLLSTSKDAAIEFQYRLYTYDFAGALKAGTDNAKPLVEAMEQKCDAVCRKDAEARREHLVTRAIVEKQERMDATVRAESFYKGQTFTDTFRVVRDGRVWRVDGRAE